MKSTNLLLACPLALSAVACNAHTPVASVLPKGGGQYEVVATSSNEGDAFSKAESEARYTCEEQEKQFIVNNKESVYQGADKDKKGDVEAENVALAFFTGTSGKERNADDYKVTLQIECK